MQDAGGLICWQKGWISYCVEALTLVLVSGIVIRTGSIKTDNAHVHDSFQTAASTRSIQTPARTQAAQEIPHFKRHICKTMLPEVFMFIVAVVNSTKLSVFICDAWT